MTEASQPVFSNPFAREVPVSAPADPRRETDALLADGSTVHIRPIEPTDATSIVELHARFSERTRYLRYFSPYPRIPPRDLARFVNVDHRDREALVVSVGDRLVAVGRYERLGPQAPDAEVAFVVEDAFQGKGIGPLLLEHLTAAAREAGITKFVAEVLPANRPMLRVFAEAGYQISREWGDGVVHLTFPIEPTAAVEERQRARESGPEAASIARLLTPSSVAVYGVRRDGTGGGATVVRHLLGAGFTGRVSAIHPHAEDGADAVGPGAPLGVEAYRSAAEVPGGVDLAVVAVPAPQVPGVVADAAAAGAHALVVMSGGFAEVGRADAQRDLVSSVRGQGMRLVGPNCLGIINTAADVSLNATFAPYMPRPGRVGVFCQSTAMGIALLSSVADRGLGVSTFVSAGNRADVSGNDLLQFWRDDPRTDVILLYLETFGNPHKFARIARTLGRDKPIVAVAAGAAAGPGSGSERVAWPVVGGRLEDETVAALFAHSGVIRVETISELLDVGQVLAACPLPAGPRVGVVGTDAALVQLADAACVRAGLGSLHARWLLPSSPPAELEGLVRSALAEPDVDTVLVAIAPPLPGSTVDEALAAVVAAGVENADKPVVAIVVGAESSAHQPLPKLRTVEEAVRALAHVSRYAQWRREPVGTLVELPAIDSAAARSVVERRGPVEELLRAYGISTLPTIAAATVDEVVGAAKTLGYPVVVKTAIEALQHRPDLGTVRLDIDDDRALRQAYEEIAGRFGAAVFVQPMAPRGVDCVVEAMDDPAFGPVVGFGVGGITTDLLGDRAWRVAPLTDVDAAALVRSPRAAALLAGYRGAPEVDLRLVEDLLMRVGRLVDENPGVVRLLLNPVIVAPQGVRIVHASVVYGEPTARPDTGPRRLV